jgi:alcohol dehydrogenase
MFIHILLLRLYQLILRFAAYIMPWRKPELIQGENCLDRLPGLLKSKGIENILIVTDPTILSNGLLDGLLRGLGEEKATYVLFDKTVQNPTVENVEEALELYIKRGCRAIIAFGGGSVIDCAKAVGARAVKQNKQIYQMRGLLKIRKRLPPFFAIPTTAGTGSETTIAAVISNRQTCEKYAINDWCLIPGYAFLDPQLLVSLPTRVTAATGMDALAHAVEAYIGRSNTKESRIYAKNAVKLIFENLFNSYCDGADIQARASMQMASYYAGLAFTRAYVGYVHAIAHTLSGFYAMAHGFVVAVLLPSVLSSYGECVYRRLAELAECAGLGTENDSDKEKAIEFIESIKKLNHSMGIPEKISGINESDIPQMVRNAKREAHPFYPVPRIMPDAELYSMYIKIKKESEVSLKRLRKATFETRL